MACGAILLAACGGRRDASPGGPTSPRPEPTRGFLLQEGFVLEPSKVMHLDFVVPPRHQLRISVDWTFASNNVIAALTSSECPDITSALQGRCEARSTSWAPSFPLPDLVPKKPRVLSYDSINVTVPARLWIANAGGTSESGAVDVHYCAVPPDCGKWGMCLECWKEG